MTNSFSEQEYLETIRQLPPPTPIQTALFANYVSQAHSWYKHLPLKPKVPFIFYLDPQAGKNFARTTSGEVTMLEVTEESERFHYTWQTTKDYRKRFGFWNYHACYGSSFQFVSDGAIVDTKGAGLAILTSTGNRLEVHPFLQAIATTNLSAAVHPYVNLGIWERNLIRYGLDESLESESQVLDSLIDADDPLERRLWAILKSNLNCSIQFSPTLQEQFDSIISLLEQKQILSRDLWSQFEQLIDLISSLQLSEDLGAELILLIDFYQSSKRSLRRFNSELIANLLRIEKFNQILMMNQKMNELVKAIYC